MIKLNRYECAFLPRLRCPRSTLRRPSLIRLPRTKWVAFGVNSGGSQNPIYEYALGTRHLIVDAESAVLGFRHQPLELVVVEMNERDVVAAL